VIPNMWYGVLEANQVKLGKPAAFRRLGEDLVFWRDQNGKVVVMPDRCPHRRSKLSPGKIVDGNIQCHFHGFQFNNKGECALIPANGRNGPRPEIFRVQTMTVREEHGFIWLWYGEERTEYPPVPYFSEEFEGWIHIKQQTQWNVDYSRAVESVIDVAHLPFVHAKTIGRGNKTLVNGPYTTLENNEMRVWISNQPDVGLPALKPSQVPPQERPPELTLKFPNVWKLYIFPLVQIVQVFAPIDEEHVQLYMRTYTSLKVPVLNNLLLLMFSKYNKGVVLEDKEIVESQEPKKADLNIGERFIPADRPLALYLQHRRTLTLGASDPDTTKNIVFSTVRQAPRADLT
jgi:phenylpropionate dioxygenase-like ring-hydroxylating dioxygenase large terminal subunit